MDTDQKILERSIVDHMDDSLQVLESFQDDEIATFVEAIRVELAALLLAKMVQFKAARILSKVAQSTAVELLEKLPISVAKNLLLQIEESQRNKLLDLLPTQSSKQLRSILAYSKNTVGAYLDPFVFALTENHTAGEALAKIKNSKGPLLQQVFVINQQHKLVGVTELTELLSIDEKAPIYSILKTDPITISASMDVSALKKAKLWDESLPYLPVADVDGVFLGIISKKTISDIKPEKQAADQNALQAGAALGDLYQMGFSGLLHSVKVLIDKQK